MNTLYTFTRYLCKQSEKKVEIDGLGKLGPGGKSSKFRIETLKKLRKTLFGDLLRGRNSTAAGRNFERSFQSLNDFVSGFNQLVLFILPLSWKLKFLALSFWRNVLKQTWNCKHEGFKARSTKRVLGREVGPSENGLQSWGHKHAHWPTSASGWRLHKRHVHLETQDHIEAPSNYILNFV